MNLKFKGGKKNIAINGTDTMIKISKTGGTVRKSEREEIVILKARMRLEIYTDIGSL